MGVTKKNCVRYAHGLYSTPLHQILATTLRVVLLASALMRNYESTNWGLIHINLQ